MRKKIVVGNWKMNKTYNEGIEFVDEIIKESLSHSTDDVLKIIATPYIHLAAIANKLEHLNGFEVAAQNCHHNPKGAYTGEISAAMIESTGAKYVIIGHSERRLYSGENNNLLAQKVNIALANNLTPIFCVGENLIERNANMHLEAIKIQLKESLFHLPSKDFIKLILAYEPVWAIGTGITATIHQAQGMHNYIRSEINKKYGKEISTAISILYGGSCNTKNAKELFDCIDVDGGLIGGSSLIGSEYLAIVNSIKK